ncbi:MAG TPA: dephospho-CoA kinase [Candidatus Mediterraneibacter stercorigallinarum]|uniref:Dephospho-CoA kinase n=1 Tax=Candidatus Mediterraneibacter stercorigallinarum TaxID=2838686 RepID=A0A9D2IK21_9FIRM|nr:dephospho-CoA kinase [Candidatus Mediterraneibacter stercorigallinarum]
MRVIGITGGVGSGKSEVLRYLKEAYGAWVCQMDETAKELQRRGTTCFRRIVEHFGERVVSAEGELDRAALSVIVFSDERELQALNEIVHPEVIRQVRGDIEEKRAQGLEFYVVEAALLPDVGRELCDELWYIYTEEKVRRERLKASRGYTDERITQMIASQPGEARFRSACTAVIDNSGDFEDTKRQIGERLGL